MVQTRSTVRHTEWRLQDFVVPQLHVASNQPFLVQLNDDEYVTEDAAEMHQGDLPPKTLSKLGKCDVRFEIGDGNEAVVTTTEDVFSFEGWTSLDPGLPEIRSIFISIAQALDGIFQDNVNGFWWSR